MLFWMMICTLMWGCIVGFDTEACCRRVDEVDKVRCFFGTIIMGPFLLFPIVIMDEDCPGYAVLYIIMSTTLWCTTLWCITKKNDSTTAQQHAAVAGRPSGNPNLVAPPVQPRPPARRGAPLSRAGRVRAHRLEQAVQEAVQMGFEEHAVRSLQDRLQCSSTSELVEQLVAAGVGPGTTATQPAVVQAYPVGGAMGVVANPMLAADVQLEREEPQLFRLNSSTGIMCARLCSFFYLDRPMEKHLTCCREPVGGASME